MNKSASYRNESLRKDGDTTTTEGYSPNKPVVTNTSLTQETDYDQINSKYQDAPLQTSQERPDSQLAYTETQESVEYPPFQGSEEQRNKRELESVPEQSMEQSEGHYRASRIDSQSIKITDDYTVTGARAGRAYNGNYFGREPRTDPKYENRLEAKYGDVRHRSHSGILEPKGSESDRGTYYSPRFQLEGVESKRNQRDYTPVYSSQNISMLRDERLSSKRHNQTISGSYNDTFGGRSLEANLHSIGKYSAIKPTSPSSNNSSMIKANISQQGGKYSSQQKQNLSTSVDYEYTDKKDKELNQSDFSNLSRIETSFLKMKEPSELLEIIQFERNRNEKLEQRLITKDNLLKQMKEFHDELYQNYIEAKEELEKMREEKENLLNDMNFQISRNEALKERLSIAEEQGFRKSIPRLEPPSRDLLAQLQAENDNLRVELSALTKKHESKCELYEEKIRKLEKEKAELYEEKLAVEDRLENLLRKNAMEEDEEKVTLMNNLRESNMQIRALTIKNDELQARIEALKKHSKDKERSYISQLDESMNETKKKIEDKLGQMKENITQYTRSKIQKYKDKIEQLKAEIDNLKLELQARPSLRKFKENEARIHALEQEMEQLKNNKEVRKSTDSGVSGKDRILKDIMILLNVRDEKEAVSKLKSLVKDHGLVQKFADRFIELVYQCSPPGFFNGKPNLKDAWKWMKRLMEEYMILKRQGKADEADRDLVKLIMDYLLIEDKADIPVKLKQLIADNNSLNKVIKKVKMIHGLERITSIQELDKRLDLELGARQEEPYHKLNYYKHKQEN